MGLQAIADRVALQDVNLTSRHAYVLLAVWVTIYAVTALWNLVARSRDDLRARYFAQRIMLRWYDLAAVPV